MSSRPIGALALLLALVVACGGRTSSDRPIIRSEIVSAREVVGQLDASRTYEYQFTLVDPESLLTALWRAHLPISQALLALDNRCLGPRGPLFTVELTQPDPRILDHDFRLGLGGLVCATTLKRFTVSD